VVGNPQRPCQPVPDARQQDRPEAAVEIEFGLSLAKVLNFRINGYFGVGSCANLFFVHGARVVSRIDSLSNLCTAKSGHMGN
jgi:hypothetical protein